MDRDSIIRSQMDTISKLINQNLKNLADELWPQTEKPKNENKEKGKIIQFPGEWHSD